MSHGKSLTLDAKPTMGFIVAQLEYGTHCCIGMVVEGRWGWSRQRTVGGGAGGGGGGRHDKVGVWSCSSLAVLVVIVTAGRWSRQGGGGET